MTVITIDPAPRYFKVSSPAEYVAHVEINRPEKLNAFHPPMRTELRQIFNQLSVHPELRVVLISGAGDKAFTAGKYLCLPLRSESDMAQGSTFRKPHRRDPSSRMTGLSIHRGKRRQSDGLSTTFKTWSHPSPDARSL